MIKIFLLSILLFSTKAYSTPADSLSQDEIINAIYDVISGPAGQERNWNRFRSLFLPTAQMFAVSKNQKGEVVYRPMTIENYIERSGPIISKNGFFEKEIHRHTDNYGNISQTFSTYEVKRNLSDEKPFATGINSIQLLNDGKRWWILTIYWQSADPTTPVPQEFLPD